MRLNGHRLSLLKDIDEWVEENLERLYNYLKEHYTSKCIKGLSEKEVIKYKKKSERYH